MGLTRQNQTSLTQCQELNQQDPTTQPQVNTVSTGTAAHIFQWFASCPGPTDPSLFMSPTCLPLTQKGTNIDSFNDYLGVQKQKGPCKAERMLCPLKCLQDIPGNRSACAKSQASPAAAPPQGSGYKIPAAGPKSKGATWTHLASTTNRDPPWVLMTSEKCPGRKKEGFNSQSQMRGKPNYFSNAIHSCGLMIMWTDGSHEKGGKDPLISIQGSTTVFLRLVESLTLRDRFTHPMTSIFITHSPELAVSLLMTSDSRRIITMVTFQNGQQSYQAPAHNSWDGVGLWE